MNRIPQKLNFPYHMGHGNYCHCGGHGPGHRFMSKKKKIKALKKHIVMLKERIEDIEEYIKELQSS